MKDWYVIARKRPGRGGRGGGGLEQSFVMGPYVGVSSERLTPRRNGQDEGIRIAVKRERGVVLILIGGIVTDYRG
jgi:hypothetical protein